MTTTKDRAKLLQKEGKPLAKPEPHHQPLPDVSAWLSPETHKNQWVIWYADRYKNLPMSALVTDVHVDGNGNCNTIDLVCFSGMSIEPHTGVRHCSYPNGELIDNSGEGCWEHSPETQHFQSKIDDLERRVADLEEAATKAK